MTSLAQWPFYDDDEIEAVVAVLRSGRANQWNGDNIEHFQQELADYFGMRHAIALSNGSVSLELALRAYGVGAGDEVIVTPRSFVASVSCVSLVGATPVFADVDPDSQNITPESIEAVITPRTKAVIPVHLAGWPCEMPAIMALAERHGLVVIEDCAQAHGAAIGGQKVGSFGHAASFSFCVDKIISTGGEGGALLLRDTDVWRRAWAYKDHGKDFGKTHERDGTPGFRWLVDSIGTNWRMTEMQAAIGRIQLTKLEGWLDLRARNARIWADALGQVEALRVPWPGGDVRHAWYKFYAFVRPERLPDGVTRDSLLQALQAKDMRALSGSCPEIYAEAAFADLRVRPLPIAHQLGETSLMFEVHPTLDEAGLRAWAGKIRDVAAAHIRGPRSATSDEPRG